jgi:hypothetical protein
MFYLFIGISDRAIGLSGYRLSVYPPIEADALFT